MKTNRWLCNQKRGRLIGKSSVGRCDHGAEPINELLSLADDASYQLAAGRDVIDEAHRGAHPPYTGVQIACFVDSYTAPTGDQILDVLSPLTVSGLGGSIFTTSAPQSAVPHQLQVQTSATPAQ